MKRRHRKKGQTARLIASVQERSRDLGVPIKEELAEVSSLASDLPSDLPSELPSAPLPVPVQEMDITPDHPLYEMYQAIVPRFQVQKTVSHRDPVSEKASLPEQEELEPPAKKQKQKVSLVELKELAKRPELIDWYDTDAKDPTLLVSLKCAPGVVQVPAHWQNKNEYLRGRGFRHHYELPDYIKDTGISSLRDVFESDQDTLRQKTRERVQPKLGKLDVDYRKLYAAFFKFQTKPKLFPIGQVYQEGREVAMTMEEFRPGMLSQRLRAALGLGNTEQPPWTDRFRDLGLPPAYPGLRLGDHKPAAKTKVWGEMVLDEPDSSDEEEEEDEELSESGAETREETQETQEPQTGPRDEPQLEPRVGPTEPQTEVKYAESDEDDASDKPLYRELSESTTEGALGPSRKYNL